MELPPHTYRSMLPFGVPLASDPDLVTEEREELDNGQYVEITRFNRKSGLLLDAETNELIFASGFLTTAEFTPGDYPAHPAFRKFTLGVNDPAPGTYVRQDWMAELDNPLRSVSWPSVLWLRGTAPPHPQGGSNIQTAQVRYGLWDFVWEGPAFGDDLPVYDVNDPQKTVDHYVSLLQRRVVASRTEVNQEVLRAIQHRVDPNLTLDDLIEVKLPFTARNLFFGEPGVGTPVRLVMLRRNKLGSVLLGMPPDTVTAPVPEDVWVPGERLMLLEEVDLARTDESGQLVLTPSGDPTWVQELRVTVITATLGCEAPRITCNPIRGPGFAGTPGYVEVRYRGHRDWPTGWTLAVHYRDVVTAQSIFEFAVVPEKVGHGISRITAQDLDMVRVVPNPYVGRSAFEYVADVRRIMFTYLPPQGTIQIFTASGQFVQQLEWTPEELMGAGDLVWNMETREGNHVAAGLYLYVLQTTDPESGANLKRTGKFVIIK
jgi:hypothetical protein